MNNYDKMNLYKKYKRISLAVALVPLLLNVIATTLPLQVSIQSAQAQYQTDQTSAVTSNNGVTNASNVSSSSSPTTAASTISIAKGSQNADNNQFFVPVDVTVKPGSTLTWKNDDTAIHTATSGKDATPDGKFDTSLISPGQSSKPQIMPSEPGEYSYFCTLHPWMTGKVIVS
jgi:plastocyanin